MKGDIPIAWVEAKDLHVSLDKVEKSEQMARYFGYANLILTNGLEFRFFKNGKRYGDALVLATKHGETIEAKPDAFGPFERLVADFIEKPADTIRSAKHLAQIMGGKAALLRDNIADMLRPDYGGAKGIEIEKIRDILKGKLIHDLTNEQFSDLYAQTLVYGLFVARYHDDTPDTFSRTEAREKIPASNHLLQQFFDHIAGANFEKELSHIVDELCEVFRHASVEKLVGQAPVEIADAARAIAYPFVNEDRQITNLQAEQILESGHRESPEKWHKIFPKILQDPIIHFYEDFLREYDPELRSQRGVFYTPLPVVRYIVRSVDALLKSHFGLPDGLADRATMEWEHKVQGKKAKQTIDRVQILDPAVGTGTFLNEVIRHIHGTFKGQEGSWPKFVEEHLLGRLNGFELMMASYTIAHLKLSMTLAETGVKETRKRLRVFLTNSLEEAPEKDDSLFQFIGLQGALTEESQLAAEVKRDLPIMVVLGNPPYSISSQNASIEVGPDGKKRKTWIGALLDDYKKDLEEQNINSLSDDYIKFIRFAHHLVERNGQGVVAMITNNSFLDGVTHRKMRQCLLETFDHIYILDLHGSSKRKEKAPDGGKDENVFDIQQGVAISIFLRTEQARKKASAIRHFDLYGTRDTKNKWLSENDACSTKWQVLNAVKPKFFFVPKNLVLQDEYDLGASLPGLFPTSGSGIKFRKDNLLVNRHFTVASVEKLLARMSDQSDNQILADYETNETKDWLLADMRQYFANPNSSDIRRVVYRPLDWRYTYYPRKTISKIIPRGDSREHLMNHMLQGTNLGLILRRAVENTRTWQQITASKDPIDLNCLSAQTYLFPLYLYPDSPTVSGETRTANLDMKLLSPALKKLKLEWVPDGVGDGKKTCGPEDIFDYIYAVLHCPSYRTRYKEFLKIDFPRVPFTSNAALFWQLVKLGREVRGLHLLESPELKKLRTSYPVAGTDMVEKIRFEGEEAGKVWINTTQYFGTVPKVAWEFFIGGYQPAQKWLKDRKGRTLSSDDILHYQKIIVALCETDRLMKEIDAIIAGAGGWPMK